MKGNFLSLKISFLCTSQTHPKVTMKSTKLALGSSYGLSEIWNNCGLMSASIGIQ